MAGMGQGGGWKPVAPEAAEAEAAAGKGGVRAEGAAPEAAEAEAATGTGGVG